MARLTDKQRRFVEAYRGNAKEAARAAGYKGGENALAVRGHRLLRTPAVAAAIRERSRTSRGAEVDELSALDDQQRAFVEQYLQHGDAIAAARAAGYRSHADRAAELLRDPVVFAAIKAEEERRSSLPAMMEREERERLLAEIARDETASPKDRIAAIVALGRMQGDFLERVEHSGEVGGLARVVVWHGNGRGPEPDPS